MVSPIDYTPAGMGAKLQQYPELRDCAGWEALGLPRAMGRKAFPAGCSAS
jgi:hypothetical protein